VPRHSVYYIVPRRPDDLEALMEYLNSVIAREWLEAHCQRAANGFLRLQSHVLKRLPIPPSLGASVGDEQVELLADAALVPA
jgi:adenine-specific DNA-methyltransferase